MVEPSLPFPASDARSGWVRLRTLILLRWLAIVGQSAAVLVAVVGLGMRIPHMPCAVVIGASALFNLVAMTVAAENRRLSEREAVLTLLFDLCQLGALLALTGGLGNPFALLIMAPVTISASVLSPRATVLLAVAAAVIVTLLVRFYVPLELATGEELAPPEVLALGSWAALLTGTAFLAIYARRVTDETFSMSQALAATQMALAREQQLSALGGVVAAAAHELGTPLATIHLVAKEMSRSLPPDDPRAEDLQLLVTQSERCRAILGQLSADRERGDVMIQRAPMRALLEEVAEPHQGLGAEIVIDTHGDGPLDIRRMPEIVHSLGGIVENAVGFANSRVDFVARWDGDSIEVSVRDDGPGFAPGVLSRLGEPYLTERDREGVAGGLGLGFFISKTLLERTGAKLTMRNRRPPDEGAVVIVRWPRPAIEAPKL
jgi:two-component system sensor histidine kinase RegB